MYDISRGQLITLWIFGIVFWISDALYVLSTYSPSGFSKALLLIVPFAVLFYTIGWRKKNNYKLDTVKIFVVSKILIKSILFTVLFAVIIIVGFYSYKILKPASLTYEEAALYIPNEYELASHYLEDLNEDGTPEALLFITESKFYNSNSIKESEGFLTLPANIILLTYNKGGWTRLWKGGTSDIDSTHFDVYDFSKRPYKLYQTDDETVIAVFHHSESFDGAVYHATFYRYDVNKGLALIRLEENYSFAGLVESNNHLYFGQCNPFLEQEHMSTVKLNIERNFIAENVTEKSSINCEEYYSTFDKHHQVTDYTLASSRAFREMLIKVGEISDL